MGLIMDKWIWVGIAVVVLFSAWLKFKSSNKKSYNMTKSSDGLWEKVKDACCIRGR